MSNGHPITKKEKNSMQQSPKKTDRWDLPLKLASVFFSMAAIVISIYAINVTQPAPTDDIRLVIEKEARAVEVGNIKEALGLYALGAVVRDVRSNPSLVWIGADEIEKRYLSLPHFESLAHTNLTINVSPSGDYARVRSSTVGKYVESDGTLVNISSVDAEEWALCKVDRNWKIVSFAYNLW